MNQESLNNQLLGLKPILSALNFVQYSIKRYDFHFALYCLVRCGE